MALRILAACGCALLLCACAPARDDDAGASASVPVALGAAPEPVADAPPAAPAVASPRRGWRIVGNPADPVDQHVCDLERSFVLDGPMFGIELSGGREGHYVFVRTPKVPNVSWSNAGGRYRFEFPDGDRAPGLLHWEGGGTTHAGPVARSTSGADTLDVLPIDDCREKPFRAHLAGDADTAR